MPLDDDSADGLDEFRRPLPPDDRIWRHPSELQYERQRESAARSSRRPPPVWAVTTLASVIGSLLTVASLAAVGAFDGDAAGGADRPVPAAQPGQTSILAAADLGGDLPSVVEIANAVRPAITRVEIETAAAVGSGSAVLFRDDGYLLTNAHVVADATQIRVVLEDGSEHDATLVGADEATDIAVLRIDGGPFPVATLGTAQSLQVGQDAVAIGSPLGLVGGASVTKGVVSALGRRIDTPAGTTLHDMIQTDAPIAPGSSGGALLDGHGIVIGITTAIAVSEVGAEGLGFATPIDIAKAVADDIIEIGHAEHVWLGIRGTDLDAARASEIGVRGGASVLEVVADSPASAAGLQADDVILSIDDNPVTSMSGLVVALRTLEPGATVSFEVWRGDKRMDLEVTLAERPASVDG